MFITWLHNYTPRYLLNKEWKTPCVMEMCAHKCLCSSVPKSWKPRKSYTPISVCLPRHTAVYLHNATKKRNSKVTHIVDKFRKYAQWKRPKSKKYILCDSIHMELEYCQTQWWSRERIGRGHVEQFQCDGNVLYHCGKYIGTHICQNTVDHTLKLSVYYYI